MKKVKAIASALCTSLLIASCGQNKSDTLPAENETSMHEQVAINTPADALAELKIGNQRFVEGKLTNTDYHKQIEQTKSYQHPHSIILSSVDSRVPPEIIFDQGTGNLFVARVAGNVEDQNIIGSMEFATKAKGTKLIVVMGHSKCGAVKGALDNVEFGNLTHL